MTDSKEPNESSLNNVVESGEEPAQVEDSQQSEFAQQLEESLGQTQPSEEEDWQQKYLRLLAEFDNFKKNVIKERLERQKYEGERILKSVVELLDEFERALSFAVGKEDPVVEGIRMIYKNFENLLARYGVQAKSFQGCAFDPNYLEAIGEEESEELPEGFVIKELKKCYVFKDKVLRYGEVLVSKGRPK
jgi:molecular chaperone GrpE